ncbi:hypothetical protein WME97_03525 [Sorangium sp. So ce367]
MHAAAVLGLFLPLRASPARFGVGLASDIEPSPADRESRHPAARSRR